MSLSKIEWTDYTYNPWWGCARVSPACRSCYADTLATRYGHDQLWRRKGPRRMMSDAHWKQPLKWNRDAERDGTPKRVFCASMADVFEDHPDVVEARKRLWDLIDATPWLHWQLLTKRPENVASMAPWGADWPENVWLGTSVENQRWAETRIPHLLAAPAKTRFLSCEPLLSELDLSQWLENLHGAAPESGGRPLLGGGDGRADDRLHGSDLAHCGSTYKSMERGDADQGLHSPAGGEFSRQVHAGPGDVSWNSGSCTGSPAGMAAFLWVDSGRPNDQSQERHPDGQPSVEPGACDLLGAGSARTHGTETGPTGSVRNEERDGEADHGAGSRDLLAPSIWRAAAFDRSGLRDRVSNRIADSQGQASISWLICGGESGAKPRPTELAWGRSIIEQGRAADVPVFVKQLGTAWSRTAKAASRKGGDPDEWPAEFRVRRFPEMVVAL